MVRPMAVKDRFDLPLTGVSAAAAEGYNRYVEEFLSYGPNLRDLFAVADANHGAPLLNAHAAALHMAFEGREGWDAARPYLLRAKAARDGGTEREQLFCGAVEAWAALDFERALTLLDDLTERWVGDLCAIKWGQYHAFNLGRFDALLRFGERAVIHDRAPYAHGMVAFALEQNHRLSEAEDQGRKAVEIAIDDAWAHHAVAHVLETQGRAADGQRWLDHCAHTWERKGVFIREHNWWHAALFRLALGDDAGALQIYDDHLWGEWPEFPQEQIGAVSMLWRLELRGADIGERWAPVVEQARARAGDHLFPFHDLHYVFAIARAGEPGEADRFVASMRDRALQSQGLQAQVWGEVAAPLGEALCAFAAGDRTRAGERIAQVMPKLHQIGGSHAQRHVFVETLNTCAGFDLNAAHAG
ncbi:MAG: tetratricopeptide repeat protein [Pseudomonadota bacterium]